MRRAAGEYGVPENNFQCIAALWSAYKGVPFSPLDVAMMMTLLKVGRIRTGTAKEDSFVDAAGTSPAGARLPQQASQSPITGAHDS